LKCFDRFVSVIVLGALAPAVLFILFWWGSLLFTDGKTLIFCLAAGGFAAGIILDLTLLRKRLTGLYGLSLPALAVIEVFYSVMVYGFFMGFPVFNAFVGILWGYIVSRKLKSSPRGDGLKASSRMIWFSVAVLFFLCVCSAALALSESTICSEIKGMLCLPFDVTMGMIWAFIIIGGAALLGFQYIVSKIIAKKIIKQTL
jgi:hypothetical protein